MICDKFAECDIKNVHIVGNKRKDIIIPSENNDKLFQTAISFIPEEIDIIQKKFYKFIQK